MKHYTHPSDATGPTYVGSRLVFPGETVFVDGEPDAAPELSGDGNDPGAGGGGAGGSGIDLAALQKGSVASIKDLLPTLAVADLEGLLALENAAPTPRTTLVPEIEAEILKRKAAA